METFSFSRFVQVKPCCCTPKFSWAFLKFDSVYQMKTRLFPASNKLTFQRFTTKLLRFICKGPLILVLDYICVHYVTSACTVERSELPQLIKSVNVDFFSLHC